MQYLSEISESLIIEEGIRQIQINDSDEKNKREDDLFDYSKDEVSISFQIQQQKNQIMGVDITHDILQIGTNVKDIPKGQGENKKKRRQIFEKYKKPTNIITQQNNKNSTQDHLLSLFDEIFKIKTMQHTQVSSTRKNNFQNILSGITDGIVKKERTPSAERKERLKIFGIKNNSTQSVDRSVQIQSQIHVQETESRLFQLSSPIAIKRQSFQFNSQSFQHRMSDIKVTEQNIFDVSRDSFQINNILQSEIFKEKDEVLEVTHTAFMKKEQIIEIVPQAQKINKFIIIPYQQQKKENPTIAQISIEPSQLSVVQQAKITNRDVQMSIISSAPSIANIKNYNDGQTSRFIDNSSVNRYNNYIHGADQNVYFTQRQKNQDPFSQNKLEVYLSISQKIAFKINNIFEEERRLPEFLRNIRKVLSIYPNFHLKKYPVTSQMIAEQFRQICNTFSQGIHFLNQICQMVLDGKSKKNLYIGQLQSSFSLTFFLDSGWENLQISNCIQKIRPCEPIIRRKWIYQNAKIALANYQSIVNYYKIVNINPSIDKSRKKYFDIRQKFIDIANNMKLISEDIYSQIIDCDFPIHFYQLLKFLREQFPCRFTNSKIKGNRKILRLYNYLKYQNDLLINSQIGMKIKEKLDIQQKYINPY